MSNLDSQFCTSHIFGTFPDHDWVAGSWYEDGIRVVDFSDPIHPVEKAFYQPKDAIFWSAYPYNGYIYANSFSPATLTGSDPVSSHAGGLYVFKLDGFPKSDAYGHRRCYLAKIYPFDILTDWGDAICPIINKNECIIVK